MSEFYSAQFTPSYNASTQSYEFTSYNTPPGDYFVWVVSDIDGDGMTYEVGENSGVKQLTLSDTVTDFQLNAGILLTEPVQ